MRCLDRHSPLPFACLPQASTNKTPSKMNSPRGIFDSLASLQLSPTWRKRKDVLEAKRYQPYADLLLDKVVWPQVYAASDEIAASLLDKCSAANATYELFVPIWSFNHVPTFSTERRWTLLYDSPSIIYRARGGEKEALCIQKIHTNNWLHWMEVNVLDDGEDSDECGLPRESIDRVIRKSDFLEQLAVRFGRNFRCALVTKTSQLEDDTFCRCEMEIQLHYYPSGLPPHFEQKREEHIKATAERTRRTLSSYEVFKWNEMSC